jgi:hypothetical protein
MRHARTHPGQAHARTEGGFALVMVVLLLFTIAVAGATGYQLVSAENELATGVEAQEEALAVARAGLERYVGEHIGVPGTPTTYAVGDGSVTVTQKRIAYGGGGTDSTTSIWLLEAVGTVPDPRYPSSPARRTVRHYAILNSMPVNAKASLISVATNVMVTSPAEVRGPNDTDNPTCSSEGGTSINGIVARTNGGGGTGTVTGARLGFGTIGAVLDTAAVRWSALEDPLFTVGLLDGTSLPSAGTFAGLPADSFPVVRVNGNLNVGSLQSLSGRGALIITGNFSVANLASFSWDGIVLAGSVSNNMAGTLVSVIDIDGLLVAGMDGAAQTTLTVRGSTQIETCTWAIKRANRSLAYFEMIDGDRWEF